MAISEKFVEHEDGRRGIIIGEEENWHFQLLTWLFLVPERVQARAAVRTP